MGWLYKTNCKDCSSRVLTFSDFDTDAGQLLKILERKNLDYQQNIQKKLGLKTSTGHIPQVKSTIHFSINKLLNHKYSPRSRRAFCKTIGTRRHFWCCLFICVMVTSCTLLTMTWGKWLVFQTHQNTSYNLRDSQNKLKVWFPHTNYFKTV